MNIQAPIPATIDLAAIKSRQQLAWGSGDYAIACTTSRKTDLLSNDAISALFPAVIEATEESAIV